MGFAFRYQHDVAAPLQNSWPQPGTSCPANEVVGQSDGAVGTSYYVFLCIDCTDCAPVLYNSNLFLMTSRILPWGVRLKGFDRVAQKWIYELTTHSARQYSIASLLVGWCSSSFVDVIKESFKPFRYVLPLRAPQLSWKIIMAVSFSGFICFTKQHWHNRRVSRKNK